MFDFDYPDLPPDELTGTHTNQMMGETWSSTARPDVEIPSQVTVCFFNFLDAHIETRSAEDPDATLFYRCVRGDSTEFDNDFEVVGDTVVDHAMGLMWQQTNRSEGGNLWNLIGDGNGDQADAAQVGNSVRFVRDATS